MERTTRTYSLIVSRAFGDEAETLNAAPVPRKYGTSFNLSERDRGSDNWKLTPTVSDRYQEATGETVGEGDARICI